jgi:hypothetical protein
LHDALAPDRDDGDYGDDHLPIGSMSRSVGMAAISFDPSFTFVRACTKRWRAAKAETLRIASLISDRLPVALAENMCLSVCAGLARTFGADRVGPRGIEAAALLM